MDKFTFELPDVILIFSELSHGDTYLFHPNSGDDRFMGDNISVDKVSNSSLDNDSNSTELISVAFHQNSRPKPVVTLRLVPMTSRSRRTYRLLYLLLPNAMAHTMIYNGILYSTATNPTDNLRAITVVPNADFVPAIARTVSLMKVIRLYRTQLIHM